MNVCLRHVYTNGSACLHVCIYVLCMCVRMSDSVSKLYVSGMHVSVHTSNGVSLCAQ